MKKFLLFFVLSNSIITNQNICTKQRKSHLIHKRSKKSIKKKPVSAMTYNLNGGRFGDNLLSYCRTKWLAEKHAIPFIYKPFQYSDNLVLHEKEQKYTRRSPLKFQTIRYLVHEQFRKLPFEGDILYIKKWDCHVKIDWKNKKFIEKLRKLIKPSIALADITLPKNCVTIAIHVRRGGGYRLDTKRIINKQPLRFVPDQFYVDQIQRIAAMFKEKNIYVHIFTDDPNPQAIVENFKRAVNIDRITYGCRESGNNPHSHVLEDFFAMMKFDCLIRPNSHYSQFVERLGDNKITIAPVHVAEKNGKKVIDVIRIRELVDGDWKIKKVKLL